MKHLKSLNYCKRMIKSTSAFGNASKGFASNELAQADKSVKDQAVRAGLIVVSGALLWANGGMVKQVNAQQQNCGDGGMTMVIDGGLMCANGSGGLRPYGSHPDDGYGPRPNNGARNTNNSNGGFDVPTRQKPSSYGAVAWDIKKILIGTAINQASKQDAINIAMQKCGKASCKVTTWYANQCVAVGDGDALSKKAIYWYTALGLTQEKAEQNLLASCSKNAKNCRVAFSECSLP